MRYFEVIDKFKDDAVIPTRKTGASAGYDFSSADDKVIPAGSWAFINTGIKAKFPVNEVLTLYIRSSLAKQGLYLKTSTSVIDSDYYNNPDNEGHIVLMVGNDGEDDFVVTKGDRIAQGIFLHYGTVVGDYYGVGNVRTGGIGSTGKDNCQYQCEQYRKKDGSDRLYQKLEWAGVVNQEV